MKLLLLFGFFECVLLVFLLLGKRKKTRPDYYLGLIFLLYGASIGGAYLEQYNQDQGFPFPHLLHTNWLLLLLHGPALWLYVKSLTTPNFRLQWAMLVHLLPFVLLLGIHWWGFLALPAEEKIRLTLNGSFRDTWHFRLAIRTVIVLTVSYHVWALLLLRSFRVDLQQAYASTEKYEYRWLKTLLWASLAVYLVNGLMVNLNSVLFVFTHQDTMLLSYGFAAVYVMVLGYHGLRQGRVFADAGSATMPKDVGELMQTGAQSNADSDVGLTAGKAGEVVAFMEREQPFLDPEISLAKLSQQLHLRPDELSIALNHDLGQSFADFVNGYRIRAFKQLRQDPKHAHLSVLGLAFTCGFNSKASFYRALKKFK